MTKNLPVKIRNSVRSKLHTGFVQWVLVEPPIYENVENQLANFQDRVGDAFAPLCRAHGHGVHSAHQKDGGLEGQYQIPSDQIDQRPDLSGFFPPE